MDRNVNLLRAIQVTALILAIKILFSRLILEETKSKHSKKYPTPENKRTLKTNQINKDFSIIKTPSDAVHSILPTFSNISYQYSSNFGIGSTMQITSNPTIVSDIKNLQATSNIKLPDRKFPTLVGAISANHLNEMRDHLPSYIPFLTSSELKKYFDLPTEIYIWNIDPDINFSEKIQSEIGSLFEPHGITITVPFFNNTDYPEHVKNLHSYAWKVLINTKMLADFGTIWWFDASIKPRKDRFEDFAKTVYEQIYEDRECFIFTAPSALHGQGWGTCHTMLDYLPTNEKIWYDTPKERPNSRKVNLPTIEEQIDRANTMEQATSMMQFATNFNDQCVSEIFLPMYYCALTRQCIAPYHGFLKCGEGHINATANDCRSACHRFDQSLANVVVNNFYKYNKRKYTMRGILLEKGRVGKLEMKGWAHGSDVLYVARTGK